MTRHTPTLPAHTARKLLLDAQGLLADPARPCTPKSLHAQIQRMGFIQIDTISTVARAHDHIAFSRFQSFRPPQLQSLHTNGKLFEHFTHDASLIPIDHWPHWRHRFERSKNSKWFAKQLGKQAAQTLEAVRTRIRDEGPLMARDFEDPTHTRGTWWDWKPAKAALEFLWRTGELSISKRINFQKVYDLTERVHPAHHALPTPPEPDHIHWACTSALNRLWIATPTEIAHFWNLIPIAKARDWCKAAAAQGLIEPVTVLNETGTHTQSFALAGWQRHLNQLPEPPPRIRILSPFDPVIRDRKRLERLFNFNYRFEAFVPEPKRTYGYYVLPILYNDQLIGRLDPKLDRDTGTLTVRKIWWEPTPANQPKDRLDLLTEELTRYATFCGATKVQLPKRTKK